MIVDQVNEWLFWTRYSRHDTPKLVVLHNAPEDQKWYAKGIQNLGIWEIIFESDLGDK